MGTLLEVTCRSCGDVSSQLDGATFSGFNPRCDQCGETTHVSISNLVATDPPGTEPASDSAWMQRHERLPDVAGPCRCGGTFKERGAPIRCLSCRSTDVTTHVVAMVD